MDPLEDFVAFWRAGRWEETVGGVVFVGEVSLEVSVGSRVSYVSKREKFNVLANVSAFVEDVSFVHECREFP